MKPDHHRSRFTVALFGAAAIALAVPALASAHAEISPKASLSGKLQLFSLAVPTEKEGATTTKVVLTVPPGFSIDSFAAAPGWKRQTHQSGSGDSAVVQSVTWTGGSVPTEEDAVFGFLAEPQEVDHANRKNPGFAERMGQAAPALGAQCRCFDSRRRGQVA